MKTIDEKTEEDIAFERVLEISALTPSCCFRPLWAEYERYMSSDLVIQKGYTSAYILDKMEAKYKKKWVRRR